MNVDGILCDYNVFLTGASGFIGTVLLQRLLNVKNADECKIFCLLRCGRKYATVNERLRQGILTNEILELSSDDINNIMVKQRIVAIEGELTDELLGLDNKIISQLKYSHNTNNKKGIVVIHCAADIDFNRELNQSININVYGTFKAIQVANEINAKSFIHISTLYVNAREHTSKHVKEEIYNSGIDFVDIFKKWLASSSPDHHFSEKYIKQIKAITSKHNPSQRQQWPNSYTFTKNMAENVVEYYTNIHTIPSSIIRLGIVSPIHKGKHLGWFMGNGGFVFLVIGIATGNIRYLNGDGTGRPDFVPVDYTCDVILSVTANTINRINNNNNKIYNKIYQCGVIANDSKWDVNNCVQYIRPRFLQRKLPYVKDNPDVTFVQSKTLFFFIELILYEIPLFLLGILSFFVSMFSMYFWIGMFYDICGYKYDINIMNIVAGNYKNKKMDLNISEEIRSIKMILYNKPYTFVKRTNFMKKARGKLNWFNANYTYFVNQRWCFDHSNIKQLYASLDSESQIKYDFDVNKIKFNQYACDSALVCFNKYIKYRDNKKKTKQKIEANIKNKLNFLVQEEKQQKQDVQQQQEQEQGTTSLSKDEKLQIFYVLRKLFFMFGLDVKVSFCIFIGMAIVAMFSFFSFHLFH